MIRELFCVLLAALIWLSVVLERPAQTTFQVPVQARNPAQGMGVAASAAAVEVTVAGPRILLLLLPYRGVTCEIDLRGAAAGTWSYAPREADVALPDRDLKLVRVFPATIPVTVAPVAGAR